MANVQKGISVLRGVSNYFECNRLGGGDEKLYRQIFRQKHNYS